MAATFLKQTTGNFDVYADPSVRSLTHRIQAGYFASGDTRVKGYLVIDCTSEKPTSKRYPTLKAAKRACRDALEAYIAEA